MTVSAEPIFRSLTSPSGERRLAAVAVADIVGYTVLMSTEGERTHARWMTLLYRTVRPLAQKYGSAKLKSTGDGVVAQFPTVSNAFAWAKSVQHAAADSDDVTQPPITFRIAIDYGEMHTTDEDVYGNVVNVAARLQEIAPPGGIALT